jgi:hypothetical protein
MYCDNNDCESQDCHRCFPRKSCDYHRHQDKCGPTKEKRIPFEYGFFTEHMTESVGTKTYKTIGDVISELNVIIQASPIDNKIGIQLADIIADLKDVDPDEDWGKRDVDY